MSEQRIRSRGVSMISVLIAMLLLALLGSVMVSMVTSERYIGANQVQALSAQYLAEAGLDRALHYFFDEQQPCPQGSNPNVFNVSLGNGHYTVATELYAPAALSLTAQISETDDQFTVDSDAIAGGYARYGIVIIGTEYIECAEVSGALFSHCKRGVDKSIAAVHPAGAKVFQSFCIVNAIGTTTAALSGTARRVVSVGFSQYDLGWAVGDQGTVIQWNGLAWSPADSKTLRNLRAVRMTAVDRAWMAGDAGVMGQYSAGSWAKQRSASVYFPENGGADIGVFDTDPHEVGLATRVASIPVAGGGATEVAPTPNGRYLYITRNASSDVVVIDPAACLADPGTCAITNTIAVGAGPRGLAVSPDGTRVYVVCESPRKIWVIRRNNDTDPTLDDLDPIFSPLDLSNVSSIPHYIALTADGTKALITTSGSGVLEVIGGLPGAPTNKPILLGDTNQGGVAVQPDDYYAYVAGNGTGQVFLIDTVNDSTIDVPYSSPGTPSQVAFATDSVGVKAFVSNNTANKILELDPATNTKSAEVDMGAGAGPTGLTTSPDGTEIYVANVTAGRINIIHVNDLTQGVGQPIPAGLVGGLTASPDKGFKSISMISPTEGWAVGDDGRLLHWDGNQWTVRPLVTMPTAPLPPNTIDNGDGSWTTTLEPIEDAYLRMNDDLQDDGTPCATFDCTNANPYGVLEPEWLKLRRVGENAGDPNNVGDATNRDLYRSYLKFNVSTVKQYSLKVATASLQLYAFRMDPKSAASAATSPTLVLRYRYENDLIPTVADSSGYAPPNTGGRYGGATYHGVGSCTDCLDGVALEFDGVNGRVITPPSTSLKIGVTTNRLTVETWVHFTDASDLAPGVNRELIRKGLPAARLSYMLRVSGGKPVFSVRFAGAASPTSVVSTDPTLMKVYQADGVTPRWYHLVGTYDGSTLKIYQDGLLKGSVAAVGTIFSGASSGGGPPPPPPPPSAGECGGAANYPGTFFAVSSDALCIGGTQGTIGSFKGWLDETRIYNGALTDEEVEEEAGWGERQVNVYRADSTWTDGQITPPGLSGLDQHNCPSPVDSSCTPVGIGALVTSEALPKWVYWNITGLVQQWVDDIYPNYGVVLRVGLKPGESDPGPGGIMWFYSADAVTPNDVYHPRLIVTYRVSRRPNLTSVSMLDTNGDGFANDGWAVGEAGTIFRYQCTTCASYTGADWTLWTQPDNGAPALPTVGLNAVSMRNNTEGWTVGDGGTLYHLAGGVWSAVASGTTKDLSAISIASNGRGLAVGKQGTILSYDGASWNVDPNAGVDLTAIKAFSNATGWGTGAEGTVIRKYGGNWMTAGEPSITPNVGTTPLRGIDMLNQQSSVTDWRENY